MSVRTRIHCLLLAIVIALPMCALAAEKERAPSEGPAEGQGAVTGTAGVTCYESADYLIVGKETPGEVGTDFLIKYKKHPGEKPPCTYAPGEGSFEIKNEWAEYFDGLKGDLLILDSTTGPGPSGLVIWDLKKRKKVYEGSWSDAEESRDNSLVFWTETGEATPENCPQLGEWTSLGMGGAIETKVILDLSTFRLSSTGETRCSERQ